MAKDFAKQFYRSKEWQNIREYCMIRDGWICQDCGRPAEEVHHIMHLTPQNISDVRISLNPDNLISLCKDCHFSRHRDDQISGRTGTQGQILQNIIFDESGNAVALPPVEIF